MHKINLFLEVSDELFDNIVEPYKKKKGFSKLVIRLLEGYMTNDAIYNYINGVIDGIELQDNESLMKDLEAMNNSLNMFSFLQQEAEANIQEGINTFANVKEETTFKPQSEPEPVVHQEHQEENLSKEEIKDLVLSTLKESFGDIESLLKSAINTQVNQAPTVAEVKPVVAETPKIQEFVARNVEEPVQSIPENSDELTAEEEESLGLIEDLLGSIGGGF